MNGANLEIVSLASRASQNKEELLFLLHEVSAIEPKVVVEIGAWRGWSLEVWNNAFLPEVLIGIEGEITAVDPAMAKRYKIIYGNSHEPETLDILTKLLAGRAIDFLFIDGDHTYQGVKNDFEMYAPLVRDGGIVGFHDMAIEDNPGVEVYKYWEELKTMYKSTEEIQAPGGTGTGILYL